MKIEIFLQKEANVIAFVISDSVLQVIIDMTRNSKEAVELVWIDLQSNSSFDVSSRGYSA